MKFLQMWGSILGNRLHFPWWILWWDSLLTSSEVIVSLILGLKLRRHIERNKGRQTNEQGEDWWVLNSHSWLWYVRLGPGVLCLNRKNATRLWPCETGQGRWGEPVLHLGGREHMGDMRHGHTCRHIQPLAGAPEPETFLSNRIVDKDGDTRLWWF